VIESVAGAGGLDGCTVDAELRGERERFEMMI
jgi:hypothetical protein